MASVAANATTHGAPGAARGAVILGALGVVFGDIGTSPLYTVQTVFNPDDPHPVAVTTDSVFGIVSMIFWSVTIVVTVTYVLLVMRADNDGEGGIMALITLIRGQQTPGGSRTRLALAALGIFGASLFLGDSMITPAISVLSAVEGLKVAEPSLDELVVPITAAIIVALFLLQRIGTAGVGRLFGPVMIVWFLTIAACGVSGDRRPPARSSRRSRRPTPWTSSSTTSRSRSSRWPRSCSRSPAPKRCMRTWGTSGARRSPARGCCSCSPRAS